MAVTKNATGDKPEELKPATKPEASGAIVEPAILDSIDMDHPSVDANPREASTADMNRIDFNQPSALVSEEEAVIENLKSEG